ncbi:amidohydrolase [Nocardia otitidiscaviarum]|uniref:amidohydrolase n=1 Tax=Nocardia otitidiscaviarum TaxID=1823 RepID=UPI001895A95B|nr:amidohydrolase [Nocardia otitidiscaviarum]MBF6177163.1 amidohydrolase [Nocardia otitidiscaviarum]
MDTADLIFTGASIITVDPETEGATAVAVCDGRILAVGGREVLSLRGPGTDVIELDERCLLPGFVEPHTHPTRDQILFSESVIDIRPTACATAAQVRTLVDEAVRTARPGRALLFHGLDPELQPGFPEPTREWLDELAPDRPIVIRQNAGRIAWANSAALRLAGLSEDTADPFGGHFERDRYGMLTGKVYEEPAIAAVTDRIVADHPDPAIGLLAREHEHFAARGVTLCGDMGFTDEIRVRTARLYQRGLAKVRTRAYETASPAMGTICPRDNGDDMFRQIGIKLLRAPDTARHTADRLGELVRAYHPDGWQLACRAQDGDEATLVLDAYEQALRAYPRSDHRLRLEHCGAMTPEQFRRANQLGVTCSLFMDHLYYWGDTATDGNADGAAWEPESHWVRARSAIEADVRISFHNDCPVTPEAPLHNMACAITRVSRRGRVLGPDEGVNLEQAIRAQTLDAAYQLFADDITGSITPGKYADLVVLDVDPYTVPPDELPDIGVRTTYLAGVATHRRY